MAAEPNPAMSRVFREMQVRETVASVSLSHGEDCACVVCKAADGDEAAFIEVMGFLLAP